MRGLLFPFADVVRECQVFKQLAHGFLDPRTENILDEIKGRLEDIQAKESTAASVAWQIKRERPLRTRWSDGDYNPKGKGTYRVRAEISFIWEIRPVDEEKWPGRKLFALDGLASTMVRVMGAPRTQAKDAEEQELAIWKVEVGDHQSPGPHFHVQIGEYDKAPFPKALEVPRLPGLVMTPMLVVETVLSELFQKRWQTIALTDSRHTRAWRKLQAPRLRAFLEWQRAELEKPRVGTSWATFKGLRPEANLLLDEDR